MHDQGRIVGRAAELELLSQRLADARGGHARTVLIGGEAGVGKSRLLSRFVQVARQAGARVLAGACEEHFGDPMPYSPLPEVLEAFRRDHGPRRATRLGGPTYQQLATLFELGGGGSMNNPQQVFLAVRRMLDHIGSSAAPVVLVLEDLHWADRSMLDLVRHLGQADPDDRHLLLVCSYRSRELRRGDRLWQLLAEATFLRRTERLELPPFGQAELAEFLAGVAGGRVDPALVERCLEWSDGIPFHAEQLMAAGALDDPDGIELPDNMRDVILARLSVLEPDALKVLQVAAVAGRAVSRQLLRKVSGLTGEALHPALQDCFDRQMLVTGDHEDVYRFRHALLREAVYRSMVRDLQVDLHIAMAEALAADPQLSLTEGSAAAEQASHWYQAGDRPRALASAVQAGQTAARTLAFPAAEVQYTRALQLWQQVAEPGSQAGMSRGRLLAAAAEAARWSGHLDRALEHIRAAVAEADRGEPDQLGELHERLATYLWEAGRRAESRDAFHQAETLLADAPASAVKARVLAGIALGHLQEGHYSDGRTGADTALAMAKAVDALAEEGRALNISGLALGMLGESKAAEERLRRSLEIAGKVNRIEDLLRAYGNLGLVLEHAGNLREAAKVTMTGLAEARQFGLGDTRQGLVLANNASAALILLGRWAEAEKIIAEGSLNRPPAESLYPRLTLAEVKVARGDYSAARELLASIEHVEHGADPRFLGPWHTIRAELALGEDDLGRAAGEVALGVAAVQGGENALELLRLCAVGMRCAADQAGRPDAGEPDRTAAIALGDQLARLVAEARPKPPTPETAQLVALCKAERQRIRGMDTDGLWNQVAGGWERLDRPYPAAYARWRQAVTADRRRDRGTAREHAHTAYQVARALGAGPLGDEVARFAEQIGLDLNERPIDDKTAYDITATEKIILEYLAEHHDAAWIAEERGVSKRTVQTHQRNIYRKLEVHSASQAVRKARQENLLD